MDKILSLEERVVSLAEQKVKTFVSVESCTGGLIAHRITNVPGASSVFLGGWITYSNRLKIEQVDVLASTLQQHGAVSQQVALEMAMGGLKHSSAELAIAVTGIAGPSGGTRDKPVGLVYFGLAWREHNDGVSAEALECFLDGSRAVFKERAADQALELLLKRLQSYSS